MVMGFSLEVEEKKDVPIIHVSGEIDVYTCPKLNTKLTEVIENGNKNVVLNLENIQYIDSTGLGTIAYNARILESSNGSILVICTKHQIKKIFQVSGLEKKNIRLFDTEVDALKEIS